MHITYFFCISLSISTSFSFSMRSQGQTDNNYRYDAIGNLTGDASEGITNISWSVYGKITDITKPGTQIKYVYDAAGNRIMKQTPSDTTVYVRDAGGNVMSVYSKPAGGTLARTEVHLYGSSRLGMVTQHLAKDTSFPLMGGFGYVTGSIFTRGEKLFELPNHLGNVLATVSDRRIQNSAGGVTVDYYTADVQSANDYYPFGMSMPGRTLSLANGYRYGFNGKEKDNEAKGEGNQLNFGNRIYDPRLGRWLSVDPLQSKYSSLSPYNFVGNTPLQAIDPDGRLIIFVNGFRLGEYKRSLFWGTNIRPRPWDQERFSYGDVYGSKNGDAYWGEEIKELFKSRYQDKHTYFVDGGYKPHSTAQERYDRGVSDAQTIIKLIADGDIKLKASETIKLVGHSHGGWHSIGMADALKAAGYPVEAAYVKNPHQPDGNVKRLTHPDYPLTQYSTQSDNVSSDQSKLPGISFPIFSDFGKVNIKITFGDWLVGDSKYALIKGATFVPLPDASKESLGGHDVDTQIGVIKNFPKGSPGYVGPPNDVKKSDLKKE
jgi:RHS repeat-associated protein